MRSWREWANREEPRLGVARCGSRHLSSWSGGGRVLLLLLPATRPARTIGVPATTTACGQPPPRRAGQGGQLPGRWPPVTRRPGQQTTSGAGPEPGSLTPRAEYPANGYRRSEAKPSGGRASGRRSHAALTRLANAAECLRSLRSLPHSPPFARMGLAAFSLSVRDMASDTTDTGQQRGRANPGCHHSDDRGARRPTTPHPPSGTSPPPSPPAQPGSRAGTYEAGFRYRASE